MDNLYNRLRPENKAKLESQKEEWETMYNTVVDTLKNETMVGNLTYQQATQLCLFAGDGYKAGIYSPYGYFTMD